jgi:hypothetical protein
MVELLVGTFLDPCSILDAEVVLYFIRPPFSIWFQALDQATVVNSSVADDPILEVPVRGVAPQHLLDVWGVLLVSRTAVLFTDIQCKRDGGVYRNACVIYGVAD